MSLLTCPCIQSALCSHGPHISPANHCLATNGHSTHIQLTLNQPSPSPDLHLGPSQSAFQGTELNNFYIFSKGWMQQALMSDAHLEKAGFSKMNHSLSVHTRSVRRALEPDQAFCRQLCLGFTEENPLQVAHWNPQENSHLLQMWSLVLSLSSCFLHQQSTSWVRI